MNASRGSVVVGVLLAGVTLLGALVGRAEAQALGSFSWQLQPYCNRVTVAVTQNGASYTLDGSDDQCGAAQRVPVIGLATPNPDGSIEFGLAMVPSSGVPVHVTARIALPGLGGGWTDSQGNAGTFAFGAAAGGAPRPIPTNVVPPGRVGAGQINQNEVQRRVVGSCAPPQVIGSVNPDGTVICQTVAGGGDITGVAAGAGLTGGGANGDVTLGVNFGGSGSATTAARSDHSHESPSSASVAIGALTLVNTTGTQNVAVGNSALRQTTTGNSNVAVGVNAGIANTTGVQNAILGHNALAQNVSGNNNIAIGASAGGALTTGNNNIYVQADAAAGNEAGTMRLGAQNVITSTFVAGINGQTSASGVAVFVNAQNKLGTLTSSRRFKNDIESLGNETLARLHTLRPVSFVYKPAFDDGSRTKQYGLIAEEVAEAFPELAVTNPDGSLQTVRYQFLAPLLLADVQRLERERTAQDARIATLERLVESLSSAIARQH